MTVLELFDLIARYGLPLVMFLGVLWLSATGHVIWRPTMTSKDETIKAKDETIEWLKNELRQSLRTAERATVSAEKATDIAKEAKK